MNLKLGQALISLQTSKVSEIPKFAQEQVLAAKEEIKRLNSQITKLNKQNKEEGTKYTPEQQAFKKARLALFLDQIYRIKRFLLIFYNFRCTRIQDQYWLYGGDLNNTEKENLTQSQKGYFANYKNLVVDYTQEVGIDLTIDIQPPLDSEVEVRMLKDCDEFLNQNGQIIKLQKNACFLMNRKLIQPYVKQGYAIIKKKY